MIISMDPFFPYIFPMIGAGSCQFFDHFTGTTRSKCLDDDLVRFCRAQKHSRRLHLWWYNTTSAWGFHRELAGSSIRKKSHDGFRNNPEKSMKGAEFPARLLENGI